MHKIFDLFPLQFRVLYRQFVLRIVDLEAISVNADMSKLLGQVAGVLFMVSLLASLGIAGTPVDSAHPERYQAFIWLAERNLIGLTMLVIGLATVVTWDNTFPDRRDVMVLSPLPVASHTILFAKVAASAAVLSVAVISLNIASGFILPLCGLEHASVWGAIHSLAAYWFTLFAASLFLYSAVLTVQGITALLLPRRLFLRLSAVLQLAAFTLFIAAYVVQHGTSPDGLVAPENHRLLSWTPTFWFFAMFHQLKGALDPAHAWLARRAWIGLGSATAGAAVSLALCYFRTMRKTVEEPELVPATRSLCWTPSFGSSLHTAIVLFSFRSLMRSRQHRVVLAFYLGIGFALTLFCTGWLEQFGNRGPTNTSAHPLTSGFLASTVVMMNLTVLGTIRAFSLPVSLTANWVLRTTQLCPSEKYIEATRRSMLLLAVAPVWLGSAVLSFAFKPMQEVGVHLVLLALVGSILVDLNLFGFYKVPFTCSYLPGKANFQNRLIVGFGFLIITMFCADFERRALGDVLLCVFMVTILSAAAAGLWLVNRRGAKSAVLYYEELPAAEITTLDLIHVPAPAEAKTAESR